MITINEKASKIIGGLKNNASTKRFAINPIAIQIISQIIQSALTALKACYPPTPAGTAQMIEGKAQALHQNEETNPSNVQEIHDHLQNPDIWDRFYLRRHVREIINDPAVENMAVPEIQKALLSEAKSTTIEETSAMLTETEQPQE